MRPLVAFCFLGSADRNQHKGGSGNMGNYTVYVNPYIVLRSGGYTKHFYIEGQRIVSKLGDGMGDATKGQKAGGTTG
jgi:hypothetical protein